MSTTSNELPSSYYEGINYAMLSNIMYPFTQSLNEHIYDTQDRKTNKNNL